MNRRRTTALTSLTAAAALTLAGCSGSGSEAGASMDDGPAKLKVSGAYVPQPVNTEIAGGFLRVTNSGGTADELVSASSDAAKEVQLHETKDGQMQQVAGLPVPAGGTLALDRGGNHLMLLGLKDKLVEGDSVEVTLRFAEHRPVTVDIPVEAANHTGDAAGHSGHDGHDDHAGHTAKSER